ncbi:SseB family protein [Amycolatopsis thermophila]|uniref:SseB protein N-terminal domain-containing protein n=1 Tax=Amycolatopsis thermophila TaxID=206084 RepID=A0ABU0ELI3_9PSEU|nr:SseB family protein [Amycolatopsis thermophila]MDQ0376137.1 hypothetical protein [Amycolatopsis thermophila]
MEPSWQPGNDLEHALQAAIDDGDPRRYARLVLDGSFYVPVLPEPGTPEREELTRQLGLGERDLIVFTSAAALGRFLGPYARGHHQAAFADLDADRLLIDPGLPIGADLPVPAISELAGGGLSTVPAAEFQGVVDDELRTVVRLLVLDDFAGEREPRTDLPPSNALEDALAAAVASGDDKAFLEALVTGEVVVPTTAPVPVTDRPGIPPLPWRLAGTDEIPVITAFSSVAMLEEVAGTDHHHTTDLMFNLFIRWPDERHVLCFNPGAATEVVLTGPAVLEMVDLIAEDLSSDGGTS